MYIRLSYCLLVFLILSGCGESTIQNKDTPSIELETTDVSTKAPEEVVIDFSQYNQLVPLEIVDSTAKNSYEKYGIEFSGNCYACDLARIELSEKHLTFVNVCDDEDRYQIKHSACTTIGEGIRIQSGNDVFTLTKIDDAPVYELTITGKKLSLDNKRISTYYTPAKKLHQFKEHDCGDFQG